MIRDVATFNEKGNRNAEQNKRHGVRGQRLHNTIEDAFC